MPAIFGSPEIGSGISGVSQGFDDLALRALTWKNTVSEGRLHQKANVS
jgi:hypothetical protein